MIFNEGLNERLSSATDLYTSLGKLDDGDQSKFMEEVRERSETIARAIEGDDLLVAVDGMIAALQSWQLTERILQTPGWQESMDAAALSRTTPQ